MTGDRELEEFGLEVEVVVAGARRKAPGSKSAAADWLELLRTYSICNVLYYYSEY